MYDANFMKIVRSTKFYLSTKPFKSFALCVSGGVDSIVLLEVFRRIKLAGDIKNFRVLHVNHGTRDECSTEEKYLQDFCLLNEIKFKVFHNDEVAKKNIEMGLRATRYEFFYKNLENNEALVMAHHLDDDIEWNLMQSLKTSSVGPSLYIPDFGERILRPFLDIKKSELLDVAKSLNLKWFEDQSNEDQKFERNYIRNSLVPKIQARFGNFTEHFKRRRAIDKDLSIFLDKEFSQLPFKHLLLSEKFQYVSFKVPERFSSFGLFYLLVVFFVKKIHPGERGNISRQIEKLYEAFKKNRNGPLLLSGGVKVFPDYGYIHILCGEPIEDFDHKFKSSVEALGMYEKGLGKGIVKADLILSSIFNKTFSDKAFVTVGKLESLGEY